MRSYEETVFVKAKPEAVFAYADDHHNFASHMNESSPMMGGGKMSTKIDAGNGQKVGSHITMSGKVFGLTLYLDEVISERTPPYRKVWETVGTPRLVVIGKYILGFEITPKGDGSDLKVFIHYAMPTGSTKILGLLLGDFYAKWCVRQMTSGIQDHFNIQVTAR